MKMAEIINRTNKKIIAKEYMLCKSIFSKALGLMFTRKSKQQNLVFVFKKEKIIPLHMLFVFYPIDVLFLDKDKRVVDIKINFRPFVFYTPKKKAKYVVELKKGAVDESGTTFKDEIDFS